VDAAKTAKMRVKIFLNIFQNNDGFGCKSTLLGAGGKTDV
jgi:hypothetical protein